jgi:hypothetical protein
MKSLFTYILLLLVFVGCQPPDAAKRNGDKPIIPNSPQELIGVLNDATQEFQEMTKPNTVRSWVDNLKVKAQPGKDMPQVAIMKEGEEARYLFQRTMRKESYKLRDQSYHDSWYLIRTQDSVVGWVHGGGILFVRQDLADIFKPPQNRPAANQRTRSFVDDAQGTMSPEEQLERERLDFLVIPGERVGPIRVNTSEEELIRMYGPSVARGQLKIFGKMENVNTLFKGTPEALAIQWKDPVERTQIKAVHIVGNDGKWHSYEGLQAGLSLLDLTKVNKSPVNFFGFNWEYAGVIDSYQKGILNKQKKFFYIVLAPRNRQAVKDFMPGFSGNKLFSSQTTGVDKLDLIVDSFVVYLD